MISTKCGFTDGADRTVTTLNVFYKAILTFPGVGPILYIVQSLAHFFIRTDYSVLMTRGCTGFDRDLEDGEAIRRLMRQIANLKLNANDNYELAAA